MPGLWWFSALTSQLAGILGMCLSCLELFEQEAKPSWWRINSLTDLSFRFMTSISLRFYLIFLPFFFLFFFLSFHGNFPHKSFVTGFLWWPRLQPYFVLENIKCHVNQQSDHTGHKPNPNPRLAETAWDTAVMSSFCGCASVHWNSPSLNSGTPACVWRGGWGELEI